MVDEFSGRTLMNTWKLTIEVYLILFGKRETVTSQ